MPREDVILFLDLETTGNTDLDEIIEVGLVLTDAKLNTIDEFAYVIAPTLRGMARILANPVVLNMHRISGLLEELQGMEPSEGSGPSLTLDSKICDWLDSNSGRSTEHIPFAGSGVMHFDRKYIRRDFPRFDKKLTYWAYDSGVLRRTWELVGLPTAKRPVDLVEHRALDDAYASIEEYREYVQQLTALKV